MTEKRRETIPEKRHGAATDAQHEAANGHSISFLKGAFVGTLVGTAVGILFAPHAHAALRSLRRQLTDTAADIGDAAADRYREAGAQVSDAVDDLHEQGREAYGKVLSAVGRGAQDVEHHATETRTELNRGAPKARRTS